MDPRRLVRLLALATPVVLLGGAYVAQYVFGLPPCEMCWWQRYALFGALLFALGAFLPRLWWLSGGLAAAAIAVSAAIGGFHAGVEYGWWEGLTACTVTPTGGGGDPLKAILEAPIIRCDVAPWDLFGISLAGWNFLISGAAALAIFAALGRTRR